jgi:glycosyltransferase involved in cell wall biosynthesis
MPAASGQQDVAILLSTRNGARYLAAQLDSLLAQTHTNWTAYCRDDGSVDSTTEILRDFHMGVGFGRCVDVSNGQRMGVAKSFLHLLAVARMGEAQFFGFADQDDVWMPEKLARGIDALAPTPDGVPALYCARQWLVDANLNPLRLSAPVRRPPGFLSALTQNIATGCTIILNRAAVDCVLASKPPEEAWHDWWCYLVVTGCGGLVVADSTPVILYRQHGANVIGAPASQTRRGVAAIKRGRASFMRILRAHVAALGATPHLLSGPARCQLDIVSRALENGFNARTAALRMTGFARQTFAESLIFRLWFLLG